MSPPPDLRVRPPHRYPFRLIDRRGADSARVLLSAGDYWSRGPARRGLALWVEAMAQAAALLLEEPGAPDPAAHALAGVEEARLDREPGAGEHVELSVKFEARFGSVVRVAASAADPVGEFARATLLLARL